MSPISRDIRDLRRSTLRGMAGATPDELRMLQERKREIARAAAEANTHIEEPIYDNDGNYLSEEQILAHIESKEIAGKTEFGNWVWAQLEKKYPEAAAVQVRHDEAVKGQVETLTKGAQLAEAVGATSPEAIRKMQERIANSGDDLDLPRAIVDAGGPINFSQAVERGDIDEDTATALLLTPEQAETLGLGAWDPGDDAEPHAEPTSKVSEQQAAEMPLEELEKLIDSEYGIQSEADIDDDGTDPHSPLF